MSDFSRDRPGLRMGVLLVALLILLVSTVIVSRQIRDISETSSRTRLGSEGVLVRGPNGLLGPKRLSSNWFIAGDIFWGRRNQTAAEANGGPAFLFNQFSTFNKDQYDAWIGNVECPITSTDIPLQEQEDDLRFNCQPQYLDEFAKWFEFVSLSNNHTDNVGGQIGLNETRSNLESVGIQHFGHYDNAVLEDICEVVSMPVKIEQVGSNTQAAELPIALCGYHGVFKQITDQELDQLRQFSEIMPTIVLPHMGAEYEPSSDDLKTRQYRAMVDRGADLVVGGHPHWVQNTEVYKDTLIVYSLGNFLFDQEWSEDVTRGIALDVAATAEHNDNLVKWLELASQCSVFKDNCLQLAQDMQLQKVELDFEFDIVASTYSGGQTVLADDLTRQILLERTNWDSTLRALDQQ